MGFPSNQTCGFWDGGICRYNIFTWSEQVSDFIEEMIQSEVILNLGIKDDCSSECGWLTLQWMLKETIAAAYCSSCSRKDLMTVFLEQLKYLNEACVINLSGSSTV